MKQISEFMRSAVSEGVFPGGVLLASKDNTVIFFEAFGQANIFTKQPVTIDTVFDLSSLTKPLAATLALMKLVQQNTLCLSQSLGSVLPVFDQTGKEHITISQLLCHRSGFPDYRPYYIKLMENKKADRKNVLRNYLVKEPLVYPTGERTLYSDLGFMVLGWIVEHISGRQIDNFVFDEIYKPLELHNLFYIDLNSPYSETLKSIKKFAATERCEWRKKVLEGEVHDDNAYAVGGIDGHAGLFGSAEDVNSLLSELLMTFYGASRHGLFDRDVVRLFFERQDGSERTLGFDTPSLPGSSCGNYFSKRTVGHLGFTGVSFWMDLEQSVIIILLTNRVHPSRTNNEIKKFRPKIHDMVMKEISKL